MKASRRRRQEEGGDGSRFYRSLEDGVYEEEDDDEEEVVKIEIECGSYKTTSPPRSLRAAMKKCGPGGGRLGQSWCIVTSVLQKT